MAKSPGLRASSGQRGTYQDNHQPGLLQEASGLARTHSRGISLVFLLDRAVELKVTAELPSSLRAQRNVVSEVSLWMVNHQMDLGSSEEQQYLSFKAREQDSAGLEEPGTSGMSTVHGVWWGSAFYLR